MLYEVTLASRFGVIRRSTRKLELLNLRKRSRKENAYGSQEHDLSLV